MLTQIAKLLKDEEAPTAVEYALMVAGIAVVIILAVSALGKTINGKFTTANTNIGNM